MSTVETSELLRQGMGRILDIWRDRLGGAEDPFYWALRLKLTHLEGASAANLLAEHVPAKAVTAILATQREINAYFDNVRYLLLDGPTQVWGTVTNALRVAADVDSVTDRQRASFTFAAASLAAFFHAAHQDAALAGELRAAFRPMPSADCQTLAALFNADIDVKLDATTLIAIVRVLGNEGPVTLEQAAALATLRDTGLVRVTLRGARGGG